MMNTWYIMINTVIFQGEISRLSFLGTQKAPLPSQLGTSMRPSWQPELVHHWPPRNMAGKKQCRWFEYGSTLLCQLTSWGSQKNAANSDEFRLPLLLAEPWSSSQRHQCQVPIKRGLATILPAQHGLIPVNSLKSSHSIGRVFRRHLPAQSPVLLLQASRAKVIDQTCDAHWSYIMLMVTQWLEVII